MAGVFLKQGLETAIDQYLAAITSGWRIRLYTNNITPDVDTDQSLLTEATFSGYAAIGGLETTPAPVWNAVLKKWFATWGAFTFNGTTGLVTQNIYLVGITDATPNVQMLKRLSTAPVFMGNAGTSLQITPQIDDLVE